MQEHARQRIRRERLPLLGHIVIRRASRSDAPRLAEIHVAALPRDLLPRIGATFLSRRFYPHVLGSDHWLVLVDDDESTIRSFIVFVLDPHELVSDLQSQLLPIAWHLGTAALRHPSILRDIISIARGSELDVDHPVAGVPELYVMATDPMHQSSGIGGRLIEEALTVVDHLGRGCIVKTSSASARRFYERHGFRPIGTERRSARTLDVLALRSPPSP